MYAYEAARFRGEPLSELEIRVLYLSAIGCSVSYIAQLMSYSQPSIKNYRQRICAKLEAKDITHAVYLACQKGLLDYNDNGKQSKVY